MTKSLSSLGWPSSSAVTPQVYQAVEDAVTCRMRIVPPAEFRTSPGRTVGGVTHEILRWPDLEDQLGLARQLPLLTAIHS